MVGRVYRYWLPFPRTFKGYAKSRHDLPVDILTTCEGSSSFHLFQVFLIPPSSSVMELYVSRSPDPRVFFPSFSKLNGAVEVDCSVETFLPFCNPFTLLEVFLILETLTD